MSRWLRRKAVLTYPDPHRTPMAQVNDMISAMTWGSATVQRWRQRCNASLIASRRRRGL